MSMQTHGFFIASWSPIYYRLCLCVVLLLGLLPLHSQAQMSPQMQEVKAAVDGLYRALSNNDAQGFSAFLLPQGFTEFNPDWSGIRRLDMDVFNAIFNSGAKINLSVDALQIQSIADNTAIVTGYRVGSITAPGGTAVASRLALTMIWLNQRGTWKLQHVHLSQTKL
jgi:ketosteroid isomerase-like protein